MNDIKILDGGMGTMLQDAGMKPGERSEVYGMRHPDILKSIHKEYLKSGSDILYADTFCANAHKLKGTNVTPEEVIKANIAAAREAAREFLAESKEAREIPVALDIGPIGELLAPLGALPFEEAYEMFARMCVSGERAGADFVIFETMSDLAELRAAIFAACENTSLPIWTTMSFEKNGRTFTGTSAAAFSMTVNSLPVSAVGVNCSLGPEEIFPIMSEIRKYTDKPLIVKPNAGLPDPMTGKYSLGAEPFAKLMSRYEAMGVTYLGGCCGTTPEYIKALRDELRSGRGESGESEESRRSGDEASAEHLSERRAAAGESEESRRSGDEAKTDRTGKAGEAREREESRRSGSGESAGIIRGVCSAGRVVDYSKVRVVGERINPTGKKRFQQALLDRDFNYIMKCALEQQSAGAEILDINVGLPGTDEAEMMRDVVRAVQSVCDLPLQIDSSNPAAIEAGLRACTGKAIVNSVNGEDEKLDAILPIVKKYGASVIGLAMDRRGLPETAEQRVEIAEKILKRAREAGIPDEEVIIDCLALTISSAQEQACETLKAVRMVKERLSLHCTLGVSNISFGLPERDHITAVFLAQAIGAGLDLPIINPNIKEMMDTVVSARALNAQDEDCAEYIERFALDAEENGESKENKDSKDLMTLEEAVVKGLGDEVEEIVLRLLREMSEMDVIDNKLIPALDSVGEKYEKGTLFLPQLINAAGAAGRGFEVIKKRIAKNGGSGGAPKGTIILATVEGDIHDIGKNIVKVVLENYGYRIIDLGKDVPPEKVVEAAVENNVSLIGLSALMTTTVESMRRTIEALRESGHECEVFVGGAVLTADYAEKIGADYYTKDAKASADLARKVFG